jgi:hypothetical protein
MDVMQFVNNSGETLEQGDVVVFGERLTSHFQGPSNDIPIPEIDVTDRAYDTRVCGIISEIHAELKLAAPDETAEVTPETKKKKSKAKTAQRPSKTELTQIQAFTYEELEKLDRTKIETGQIGWMMTLGLYANCKVDADIAPIKIGDLLTTSPTKGHAQKVLDSSQAVGAILGKALGSLKKGKGKIPVLVMLQ